MGLGLDLQQSGECGEGRRVVRWRLVFVGQKGPYEGEKKVFLNGSLAKRPRGARMFNHGWWRLVVGDWRLAAVGGGWRRLVVGDWWLVAVSSGWRLAVGGGWWLAVGVP